MSTWFITGASRGLGLQIARAAVAGGDAVVAAARNPDGLPDDLKQSGRVLGVPLDVTRGEQVTRAVDAAIARFGAIDVLVNNAGRGLLGALEEITDAEARSLFDLNVFGLINVTRAVLPGMRAAGHGKIVNIGSRSGFEGEPGVSMYSASKFAVAGISEALSAELEPFGVQCMVVEPGVFRTDFLDTSSLSTAAQRIDAYDGTPAHVTLDWAGTANHTQLGDPVKGAALIYEVTCQDKLPGHLYLGADTLERLEVKLRRIEQDLAPWRDKSAATAHEDVAA
ncbi:SDR family NAD(P)-dependent oxidoreductase [Actinoallomurus rhizosphaericola]|uniref:SDR family NAD(P)-dependent oxidoreductase n=1 Tax=Actinoallomurus rhizosphaericola TaxID=2952536 RepID=UPI0020902144|nr:SDR family NAD(P)-dependent oxidoreductase [Actinoallomurus rhizosphaericola]MCO5992386.1 SDR family NAD(P)-dependent oxidoreductase [Actinoallomurus rhizosphaericola]